MDIRIANSLEAWLGYPLDYDVANGNRICLRLSPTRTDNPNNRLVINRTINGKGVIATCIPRLYDVLTPLFSGLREWELFSDYGLNLIRRNVCESDGQYLGQGFSYAKGIWDLNVGEAQTHPIAPVLNNFGKIIAFEYCVDGEAVSRADIVTRDDSGTLFVNVETHMTHRGKGYGLEVVRMATREILKEGFVARYGAETTNFSSIAIARRLSYTLVSHHIVL